MKNIVIGQYIPGEGFFYRLDPRTKIISVIVLMVAVFLLDSIYHLLVASGVAMILLLVGKISIGRVFRGLRPLLVLLVFTFVFQILFNRQGAILVNETLTLSATSIVGVLLLTVLWRMLARRGKFRFLLLLMYLGGLYLAMRYLTFWWQITTFPFVIYEDGVTMSIFVIVRLVVIITLSTVLTLTTKPTDLTQGLEKLMRPLKVIGIRSEDFALIISISLRFIPTILDEANKIMSAQASRGADFAEGKLKDKIKQVISLLVPMFIIAFKRSEELADAMESRNFVPGKPRSRINELVFNRLDVLTSVFVVMCLTGSILIRVL
ncbi:MAG: energy-coupling factor transporter transmembrane protein EcfT [Bacilli bacterium]|nr:energy-coupling factor transporter transmembrane protein EcfT [Bacilli bacterium]